MVRSRWGEAGRTLGKLQFVINKRKYIVMVTVAKKVLGAYSG